MAIRRWRSAGSDRGPAVPGPQADALGKRRAQAQPQGKGRRGAARDQSLLRTATPPHAAAIRRVPGSPRAGGATMIVSLTTSMLDVRPQRVECSWDELVRALSTHAIRTTKDGPLFSP